MQNISSTLYDYDMLFKAILIGDSGVGKSCIASRFHENRYIDEYHSTIGIDFKSKDLEVDGERVKIMLYDCSGQERFRSICSMYFKGSQGAIFVYDISNRESFTNIWTWIKESETALGTNIPRILIGNKCDTQNRQVMYEEGKALARKLHIKFYETSANSLRNVQECFKYLVNEMIEDRDDKIYHAMILKREKLLKKQDKKRDLNRIFCCASERND